MVINASDIYIRHSLSNTSNFSTSNLYNQITFLRVSSQGDYKEELVIDIVRKWMSGEANVLVNVKKNILNFIMTLKFNF